MRGSSGPFALLGVVLVLAAGSLLGAAPAASAETYREAVEGTAGVSHFWPMGEASGSSFADVVGGANAAVSGGVTLGEPGGLVGDASTSALFDGSSGAAQANVDLSGTHELTVEFWMKWSAYGSDDHLALEFTPNFNDYEGGFLVDPDATPGSDFAVSIGLGPSSNTVFFERPSAGEWHYYAFVIDTEAAAEEEITPYVDGHRVSYTKSRTGTGAGNFADSTLFWMSRDASTLFGAGSMQDLALYETALSSGTILHHYALGAVGPKASFTDAPVVATAGVPVRLNASGSSSTVGPIADYAWDFNGGKTLGSDAGESPDHLPHLRRTRYLHRRSEGHRKRRENRDRQQNDHGRRGAAPIRADGRGAPAGWRTSGRWASRRASSFADVFGGANAEAWAA